MNNSLNLASRPFSNRILPWALTAIILFVSLIGLIFVIRLTTNARNEAAGIEAEIIQLKQREHGSLEQAKKIYSLYHAADNVMLDEPWDYNRLPQATEDRVIQWMLTKMK